MRSFRMGCVAALAVIGGGVVLLIVIAAIAAAGSSSSKSPPSFSSGSDSSSDSQAAASDPGYKLALISQSCSRPVTGFIQCTGFVQNLTGAPLKNIEAVVTDYDGNSTPVSSDEALIDYNPVLAGQQSPWKVIITDNPAYKFFRVSFKDILGGSISTRNDLTPAR